MAPKVLVSDKLSETAVQIFRDRGIDVPGGAAALALYTQVVLQGSFVLVKASSDASIAENSIDHLKRYIELLFARD